ncbi:laminin subunit alpha isoform X3 [Biomphalaria glabrata]|nr:laminin subunit alpha isoform X3 [Biomphalaria glabrata]
MIRPCYRFNGNRYFRLTVVLLDSTTSLASFAAIPLEMWSTIYYFVVLRSSSVLYLLAGVSLNVTLTPKFEHVSYVYHFREELYRSGAKLMFQLDSNLGFPISFCNKAGHGSVSGTLQANQPIGLITTNCHNVSNKDPCLNGSSKSADISSEMLLGEPHYGTDFITLSIPDTTLKLEYYVVAREAETNVQVLSQGKETLLKKALSVDDNWVMFELINKATHITSDKPIQMILVLKSPPCGNGTHNAAVVIDSAGILIPTHLFFNRYFWIAWSHKNLTVTFTMIIAVNIKSVFKLLLDNKKLQTNLVKWKAVNGEYEWKLGLIPISGYAHDIFEMTNNPFGCYIYTRGPGTVALNPAGFKARMCERKETLDGLIDDLDNDCDGLFNEEEANGIDDDFDLRIDEDLNGNVVDSVNVPPNQLRNKCPGDLFGDNCLHKCHCDDSPCNRNGNCLTSTRCSPGWFGPACQYRDLCQSATFDHVILNDNDDTTCLKVPWHEIKFRLSEKYPLTWIRMVFGNNDRANRFSLKYAEAKTRKEITCNEVKIFKFSSKIYDVFCLDVNVAALSVSIKWEGGQYLCSVHMSGGRNIAFHTTSKHLRSVPPKLGDESPAPDVVDGSLNQTFEGVLEQNISMAIDIILSPLKFVYSVKIFIGTPTIGSQVEVQLMDESEDIIFDQRKVLDEHVAHMLNPALSSPLAKIRILLITGSVAVNEVEVFGECAPPFYDLGCSSFCGLSCQDELCSPEGMCFKCHPKKSGRFCRDIVFSGALIDDYLYPNDTDFEEAVGERLTNAQPLLIVASLLPILGLIPCIVALVRGKALKAKKTESDDAICLDDANQAQHWPSPTRAQ